MYSSSLIINQNTENKSRTVIFINVSFAVWLNKAVQQPNMFNKNNKTKFLNTFYNIEIT